MNWYDSGLKKSTEQAEKALARAIPIETANAAIAAHRRPARPSDHLYCISLIDDRSDFRGRPVFQLFTARQGLQDTVELRKQLFVIARLDSYDNLVGRR
jgi:hypothetical protein